MRSRRNWVASRKARISHNTPSMPVGSNENVQIGIRGYFRKARPMAVKKKVVLIGDAAVGKTSLIRRYVFDRFDDAYITTIGSKVTKKEITVRRDDRDVDLKLMIWDILGREGYVSTHARTFAGVHGAILVADLTRRDTLDTLERYWIPLLFKVVENAPLVFVCNKSDLQDEVTFGLEDLQQTASRYNRGLDSALPEGFSTSLSTSAKTGENVERAFESLGHLLLSGAQLEDPIKDLYESLVAMGVHRQTDRSTLIGALDAIYVDFCEGFDDDRLSMTLLRQETLRAGLDVNAPSKEALLRFVEYLAEAESAYKDEKETAASRDKRMEWAKRAEG